jgi:hypothetical protein
VSSYSLYALPNSPAVADVHRELVAKLAAIKPPPEKSVYASPYEQAVGLRQDASYLAELQKALEPVIEAVVDRAVSFTGMRDVSDRRGFPYQVLEDDVLDEFKAHASLIEEEAGTEKLRF